MLLPTSLSPISPPALPGSYPELHPLPPLFLPQSQPIANICDPETNERELEKLKRQAEKSTPKLRPGKWKFPDGPGGDLDACQVACYFCFIEKRLRLINCPICIACWAIPGFTDPQPK